MLDVKINKNNSEKNIINNLIIENNSEKNNLINKKIIKNNAEIKFIKLDNRVFEEKNINISEINSEEELIEKINEIKLEKNKFYKIILIGEKNIETNTSKLCKLVSDKSILKIKDKTEMKYDLDNLAKQNNLKGLFVKRMLEKIKEDNSNADEVKKSIEIGLKAFEQ